MKYSDTVLHVCEASCVDSIERNITGIHNIHVMYM
jgi:hypothetical protein